MPTLLSGISPADLDFPPKFSSYRPAQEELVDFCLYGPNDQGTRKFMAAGAPPGIGKSLTAHTIGKLSGLKYGILTATRSLEDQMVSDQLVDGTNCVNIRGRANYTCNDFAPLHPEHRWDCEKGADDNDCPRAGRPGCTYFDRVQEVRRARGFVSNYQYWIKARMHNQTALELPGQPVGMLILDEAHLAMGELARALAAWASNEDLHRFSKDVRELIRHAHGEEWGRVSGKWVNALDDVILGAQVRQTIITQAYGGNATEAGRRDDEYKRLTRLIDSLSRVSLHGRDNNWIWRQTKNGISFDCVWPGRYAERYLWSGVQRIVLLSATLVPKALHLLRIPATEYHFREWPRQFPKHLSPVYWVPTGKMGRRAGDDELAKCVAIGEEIFAKWGHRKGIVHSASYRRAEWLQSMSSWGRHMLINERGEASDMVERYRTAKPPSVLVSPSYTTGFDLGMAEWIWIPKLPFPDRSDPIVLAREEDDPDYYQYETMQTLVQACGRASRHEKDTSTTIITDDAIKTFRKRARRFAPRWYTVEDSHGVPEPND